MNTLVKYPKVENLIAKATVSALYPLLSVIFFIKSVFSKQKMEFSFTGPIIILLSILGAWSYLICVCIGASFGYFFSHKMKKNN